MRIANDVAYCIGEQHSLHLVRDNAGNLIALSAQLCRSGFQSYSAAELGVGGNELVNVYRPKDEVLSAAHLASIEAKSVTLDHPSEFLTPSNTNYYRVGHVQNVRRGPDEDGEVTVIGDVHVTDQRAIDQVAQGVRDLSLGYTYELDEGPEPGTYTQRNLRANHCAIVPKGRAGSARIIDRAITGIETVAQFVGRTFEETVQRFHRKNANDVVPHSENKESPMLEQLSTTDEIENEENNMDRKELLDALNANSVAMKQMFDDLKTLMSRPKAKDDGCNCGGKKTHSDACPMYTERAEDMDENFGERDQNRRGAPELIPLNSNGGGEGNVNPVSARDCQEALNNLRTIRHVIADSGDRRAILAYNQAIVEVKKKLADALMRGPERVGPDPTRQAMDRVRTDGADYEESCRNLHRVEVKPGTSNEELTELAKRRRAKDAPRHAVDSQREIAEGYEDSVKAARTKALKK